MSADAGAGPRLDWRAYGVASWVAMVRPELGLQLTRALDGEAWWLAVWRRGRGFGSLQTLPGQWRDLRDAKAAAEQWAAEEQAKGAKAR